MSNTRRLKQPKQKRSTAVLDWADDGPQTRDSEEQQTLRDLRRFAAGANLPAELQQMLAAATSTDEAFRELLESGLLPEPEEALEGALSGFAPLLKPGTDQLDAELSGLEFVAAMGGGAPSADAETLMSFAEQAEAHGTREALAALRVLAAVGPEQVRQAAAEGADRLVAAGLADVPWAAGLGAPEPAECFGYADIFGSQQSLVATFRYGRKKHALCVLVDYDLGGGIKDCYVTDQVSKLKAAYRQRFAGDIVMVSDYTTAQAAEILADALAAEPCPEQPDQVEDVHNYLTLVRARAELLNPATPPGRTTPTRSKDGRPRVHRLKVTLLGTEPPIWRELEVPSDITLADLHDVLQLAFGWEDAHLWRFETSAGDYGIPGHGSGMRSAARKELAAVASRRGSKFTYEYDFGDCWQHQIRVEEVLPAEPGVAYPRCTDGRRAGPPEDCGGVWGYADLLETLADSESEDHEDRLEWLGIESAAEFDAERFDADAVNKALSGLARLLTPAPDPAAAP